MKTHELVDALNQIEMDESLQHRLIQHCTESQSRTRSTIYRPITAVFICFLVLMFAGLPCLLKKQDAGKFNLHAGNTMNFQVKTQDRSAFALKPNIRTLLPSENFFVCKTEIVDGQEIEMVVGMIAPDFIVEGDNIESVTYTAQNGTLFCEYNSYDHDEKGNFLWSNTFALAKPEDYKGKIEDPENPTKQELVAVLETLHCKGNLEAFYHMVYSSEYAKTNGKTGTELTKALEAFQKKCTEAIDFNQFTLSSRFDDEQEVLEITIINPEHPPLLPTEAQTIKAESGDTVTWYIGNGSELRQTVFGRNVDEVDFSQINDIIEVVVVYKNNAQVRYQLVLNCSSSGEFSLQLQET